MAILKSDPPFAVFLLTPEHRVLLIRNARTRKQTDNRRNMFIERIQLKNLLSFGLIPKHWELRPLNVLIGPNAPEVQFY